MADKTVIAHLSDLHCGSRYHIPSLATRVIDEVNVLRPHAVIVTGDLTDMGFRAEFRQAHRMLERLECENVFVLIGNHDARNVGEVHFEELFGSRRGELSFEGLRVIGLDSSEPDLDSGRIGRETYRFIEERCAIAPEEFKIVSMHHHLVPVPGTGRERNVVFDAGDLLRVLADNGVDLVLCGHKHVPNVWRLEDMLIVNAGTCCTHRLRGYVRPTYNIIEIDEGGSHVRVHLKEPFVDSEIVGDYHGIHQRACGWRPEDEDETGDHA
ncbi:MAG: metallophosphoesterase [Actinomycetota bacterium]|nr:metallophosphoesterase [Actinomycetota bacterium]